MQFQLTMQLTFDKLHILNYILSYEINHTWDSLT